MEKAALFQWDQMEWISMHNGIRRKQVWLGKIMAVRLEIPAGVNMPTHQHPHEQCGNVLQGILRVSIEGREMDLRPGAGYMVGPDVPHGVASVGTEPAVVLEIFTPPREDLMK